MNDSLLILFVKHPVPGQVKTRLAADTNTETALSVYNALLEYTETCVREVPVKKRVAYGNFIPETDFWQEKGYERSMQSGDTLGKRMSNAISEAQKEGYSKVVLIGSDCAELSPKILTEAFENLQKHSVVIGPAGDGGYYLIGMSGYFPFIFENKDWSTDSVLPSTLSDLKKHNISFKLLPELNDIDTLEDLILSRNTDFSMRFIRKK
ncbi:MAG: TIGR04282 family arsenosugar biosynthesis glycosyltransferase [Bacteroidia bacterium]|nr:TIGR04282 family arsenosugar biosynthesis glycosyltransferase [Bacteroidia bacterium]